VILDAIAKRQSIRSYKDEPIKEDELREVLDAGRIAPSGCNKQPWTFVVVQDRVMIGKLVHAIGGQDFVGKAAALVVACKDGIGYHIGKRYDGGVIDITIALDHMTLQAASIGIGTCWLGMYDGEEVEQLLGIPAQNPVVAILAMGYPEGESGRKPRRKDLDSIICWEKFTT
jgi:nitroreductase